jgi:homoserine O-acetyltransferase
MATDSVPTTEQEQPTKLEAAPGEYVETKFATLFEPPQPLKTDGGATIGPVTVAYETYGTLSPEKDNAIFVCHALTGDAHAAGRHGPECEKPGWWDDFIGPGKGLDTNEYFVICANVLGGCQGTTGPGSISPTTGLPFCLEFPVITVGDIISVHAALVEHLGIEKLLSVIGGSLGGMQVLEWAARFPDKLSSAVVLASAANLSAQGIAFNTVGRRAIMTDPHFKDGRHYKAFGEDEPGPRFGLALARMLAHITYLSEASMELKFGRRLQHSEELGYELQRETEFQIESYLHYQGKRFVERFDANSYLFLTKAMDYFHLADSYSSLTKAVGRTDASFLVVSYSTDWLFPTSQSKELVAALIETGRDVSFIELDSPYGHDSFLIELEPLTALIQPFLAQTRTRRNT